MTPVLERLERNSIPVPESGCFLWLGNVRNVYGSLVIANKTVYAHRAAYECANGAIPDGLHVCHRCDTPLCINPAHLFAGSRRGNMRDKVAKGRANCATGEAHHCSKLTDDKVISIRADERDCAAIGRDYGVTKKAVRMIKLRKTWRHVQ